VLSTQILAASVKVSDNLIVSEVNDKSVEHGFIGNKSSFELPQGNHALIVKYKDVFEDLEFAEERLIESQDFVVKFTITDQKQLNLSTIKIKNLAGAEYFAKSPELTLQDEHDNLLNLTLEKVSDYKLAKQVDIVVNSLATKQVTQPKSHTLTTSAIAAKITASSSVQVNSLMMLKYWWQNASSEEKQRFKQFTNAN
jgi:uncharacterized protein YccT (UPF0319 family)